MKLSDYAINAITPFVTGDNKLSVYRRGSDLVNLFNKFGFRDVYDYNNGGLPLLSDKAFRHPSRTEYVKDRLHKISGKKSLRSAIEEVMNTSENKEECIKEIANIINPEGYTIEEVEGNFIIIGGRVINREDVKNEVSFIHNQNLILAELDKAQVSISLAMAWFTNDTLANKLKEKQKQGIRVEIVIFDDGVNAKHGVDLTGLDVIKVRGKRGGIMHNKFCVIDNQIVLHGSYNWSCNAEYKNDETVQVSEDPKLATKFSVEFRELRGKKEE